MFDYCFFDILYRFFAHNTFILKMIPVRNLHLSLKRGKVMDGRVHCTGEKSWAVGYKGEVRLQG